MAVLYSEKSKCRKQWCLTLYNSPVPFLFMVFFATMIGFLIPIFVFYLKNIFGYLIFQPVLSVPHFSVYK